MAKFASMAEERRFNAQQEQRKKNDIVDEIKRIKLAQAFIRKEMNEIRPTLGDIGDSKQADIIRRLYWVIENLNFIANGELKREETK